MGCAMWAYKAWQGRQLPERLSRDEQLPAYAGWCNAAKVLDAWGCQASALGYLWKATA